MPFYRIQLNYVVEVDDTFPHVNINNLIERGLAAEVPKAIQILPGSRFAMTKLARPPKSRM